MWLSFRDLDASSAAIESEAVDTLINHYNDWYQHEELSSSSAVNCLNLLLEHYPNHEALLIRRAHFYDMYDSFAALSDLNTILSRNPLHEEALKLRLSIYFKAEDFRENALSDATALLALRPHEINIPALSCRGEIYYKLGQPDKALTDFGTLLASRDFSSETHRTDRIKVRYLYAQACVDMEQHDDAMFELNKIFEMEYASYYGDAMLDDCLLLRSKVHEKKGDLLFALDDLNQFLAKYPKHIEALKYRIQLYTVQMGADADQVTLDRYALYRATHQVTQLQEARAILSFYEEASDEVVAKDEVVANMDAMTLNLS